LLRRTIQARLLDELRRAGAKVVAFDIVFTGDIPNEDVILAQAIRDHGNVLCGVEPQSSTQNGEEKLRFTPPALLLRQQQQKQNRVREKARRK